jgi:hypothetical protein
MGRVCYGYDTYGDIRNWRCFALSHAEGRLCEQEELED